MSQPLQRNIVDMNSAAAALLSLHDTNEETGSLAAGSSQVPPELLAQLIERQLGNDSMQTLPPADDTMVEGEPHLAKAAAAAAVSAAQKAAILAETMHLIHEPQAHVLMLGGAVGNPMMQHTMANVSASGMLRGSMDDGGESGGDNDLDGEDDGDDDDDGSGGKKRKRGGGVQRQKLPRPAGKDSNCRNQTGYIGVRMRKWGMFAAEIRDGDKRRWLGSFGTAAEAGMAYDAAAISQKGPKAKTNFKYLDYGSVPRPNAETLEKVRWDFLPKEISERFPMPAMGGSGGNSPAAAHDNSAQQRARPARRSAISDLPLGQHEDLYAAPAAKRSRTHSLTHPLDAYGHHLSYQVYGASDVYASAEEEAHMGYFSYPAYPALYQAEGLAEGYEQAQDYGLRTYPAEYAAHYDDHAKDLAVHHGYKSKKGPTLNLEDPPTSAADHRSEYPRQKVVAASGRAHHATAYEYPAAYASPYAVPAAYTVAAGLPYGSKAYMLAPTVPFARGYTTTLSAHPEASVRYEAHEQDLHAYAQPRASKGSQQGRSSVSGAASARGRASKAGHGEHEAAAAAAAGSDAHQDAGDDGAPHGDAMPEGVGHRGSIGRASSGAVGRGGKHASQEGGSEDRHRSADSDHQSHLVSGQHGRGSPAELPPASPVAVAYQAGSEGPVQYEQLTAYPLHGYEPVMHQPYALYPQQYMMAPATVAASSLYASPSTGSILKPRTLHHKAVQEFAGPHGDAVMYAGAFQPYAAAYHPDLHMHQPHMHELDERDLRREVEAGEGGPELQNYYKRWKELTAALHKAACMGGPVPMPSQSVDDVVTALSYMNPPGSANGAQPAADGQPAAAGGSSAGGAGGGGGGGGAAAAAGDGGDGAAARTPDAAALAGVGAGGAAASQGAGSGQKSAGQEGSEKGVAAKEQEPAEADPV